MFAVGWVVPGDGFFADFVVARFFVGFAAPDGFFAGLVFAGFFVGFAVPDGFFAGCVLLTFAYAGGRRGIVLQSAAEALGSLAA